MAWYWIVLIVVGSLLCLWIAFCILAAKMLLNQAATPVAHTLDEARVYQSEKEHCDFSDYDNVWKKQDFALDGVHGKIRGEIIFNVTPSSPAKVVIICHGHTWNRLNSLKYAKIFYDNGYNLVMYDHGYFGESDGTFTSLGDYERYDLNTVIDHAKSVFGSDCMVGLHGESMGAATVLLLLGLRSDVSFVVADCPFSDTMSYYRELCWCNRHLPSFPVVDIANALSIKKFGYDFRKVSPIKAVKDSPVPVCLIHGKQDDFIFPKHSQAIFEQCKNPLSQLHLVESAKHAESYHVDPAAYANIVGSFLKTVEVTSSIDEMQEK